MKNAVMSAALLLAALGARAEMLLGPDRLSREILAKTAQANAGVTAVVRLGSGQAVELKLADASVPFAAKMAPAAAAPGLAPKPAPGLAPKAAKARIKKRRRAVEQLRRVSASGKDWR